MANRVTYYQGGLIAAAPQQNRSELYDGTAGTYTSWDVNGVQTAARALTAAEATDLAATDATNTQGTNKASLQAALDLRLGQIEAFIAANPNGAVLTAAQTLVVAKMLAGLTRIVRNAISTTGQAG